MSMLDNAITSIQLGMEDFHDDDPRRLLSAIRNLYAGLLLLFKCKLQELSPPDSDEALLKTFVLPAMSADGETVVWVGKGQNTVDYMQIQERLKSLGVTGVEWKLLERLQKIRNQTEHYYSQVPQSQMREAVANSLQLIVQFCHPYLNEDPAALLGLECWQGLVEVEGVYALQLKNCQETLEKVNWAFLELAQATEHIRCPDCDSQLVRVDDPTQNYQHLVFTCTECQESHGYEAVMAPALCESMAGANYVSVKDGGDGCTGTCPYCDNDTFLIEHGQCAICFEALEHTECILCGEGLGLEDQEFGGLCGYHHYVANKDD